MRPAGLGRSTSVDPGGVERRASESRLRVPEQQVSEPRIRVSPPYGDTLSRIRGILRRYLSPIIVDSVLDKAMRQRDASAGRLTSGELAELTGDIMIGLRLF